MSLPFSCTSEERKSLESLRTSVIIQWVCISLSLLSLSLLTVMCEVRLKLIHSWRKLSRNMQPVIEIIQKDIYVSYKQIGKKNQIMVLCRTQPLHCNVYTGGGSWQESTAWLQSVKSRDLEISWKPKTSHQVAYCLKGKLKITQLQGSNRLAINAAGISRLFAVLICRMRLAPVWAYRSADQSIDCSLIASWLQIGSRRTMGWQKCDNRRWTQESNYSPSWPAG